MGADGKDPSSRTSRRDFAKSLGLVAVSPLLVYTVRTGGEEKPSKDKPNENVANALTQVVQSLYGQYLTPDQLKEITKSLQGKQRAAEAMKKVKLRNGDEPAFIFFADAP